MRLELWDFTEIVPVIVNTCISTWQPNSRPADFKFNVEKNWGMNEGLVRCKLLDPAPKDFRFGKSVRGTKSFPFEWVSEVLLFSEESQFPFKTPAFFFL